MRITDTSKYILKLFSGMLVIVAVVFYIIFYHPQLAYILYGLLMCTIFFFIIYVNVGPITAFLGERASDIMAIYTDASGKGLHVFSTFHVSRIKSGLPPLRTIQYYFFVAETGKNYYKILFSHELVSASGHSGYEDFSSFEEDVLHGEDLKAAIEKFSAKLGWQLQPGEAFAEGEAGDYRTETGGRVFQVEKKEGMIVTTLKLACYDTYGKLLWRKKL